MERVVRAAEGMPHRPSEAMLSAPMTYRTLKRVTRGDSGPAFAVTPVVSDQIKRDRKADEIERLHALGVVSILAEDHQEAVRILRRALNRAQAAGHSPREQASLWNDLAVAHYELGRQGAPEHFVTALDCIERAWRITPSPATTWTRALILEQLHLDDAAIRTWKRYLELDPASPWADEARSRLSTRTGARKRTAFSGKRLIEA